MSDENPSKRALALEQLLTAILLEGERRVPGYINEVCQLGAAVARVRPDVDGEYEKLTEAVRLKAVHAGLIKPH